MSSFRAKRVVLAVGIAGVAASGAIYGAQLKTQQESKQAVQAVEDENQLATTNDRQPASPPQSTANPTENSRQRVQTLSESEQAELQAFNARHVAVLEHRRADLLRQRGSLQKKLDALLERKAANEAKRMLIAGQSANASANASADAATVNRSDVGR